MEILFIIIPPFVLLGLCVMAVRMLPATSKTPTCMDTPEVQIGKLLDASGPEDVRFKVGRDEDGRMVKKSALQDPWSSSTFTLRKRY
jgi:hypothetical protein